MSPKFKGHKPNNTPDLKAAIRKHIEENAGLRKQVEDFMKEKEAEVKERLIAEAKEMGGMKVVKAVLPMPAEAVKNIAFQVRQAIPEKLLCVIGSVNEGKPMLTVMISDQNQLTQMIKKIATVKGVKNVAR